MKMLIFFLILLSIATAILLPSFFKTSPLYWGIAVEGDQITMDQINAVEKKIDIKPQFVEFYIQWPSLENISTTPLPINSLNAIWESKAIPCLTWEPMYFEGTTKKTITSEQLLSGVYDPYLSTCSRQIKEWPGILIIRLAHEMNLEHYHWGSNKKNYGPSSPATYIQMYQYVVNFFKNHQVNNVLWAFCPNAESIPSAAWNSATNYYPGDAYVDVLGIDGYNWGKSQNTQWKSFSEIFSPMLQEIKQISSTKPVLIFETAAPADDLEENAEAWLKDAITTCRKWNINGIIWFYINKEHDWRLGRTPFQPLFTDTPSVQEWARLNLKVRDSSQLESVEFKPDLRPYITLEHSRT